jgi:creatinine amidohydrolase
MGVKFLPKTMLMEMTWSEVKEALKETNVAIIPVGSIEQHGLHLPLGTDYFQAIELAKRVAEKTAALVAPVILCGHSQHHMGFPGTISLKPETLAQVIFEACQSLGRHGFNKIIILNTHGGNDVACSFAAQKVNTELDASAVFFGAESFMKHIPPNLIETIDLHAGVDETSSMLVLNPEKVRLERARKPKITLPLKLQLIVKELKKDPSLIRLILADLPMLHEISDTGSLVLGNPADGEKCVEETRKRIEETVDEIVNFVKEWKKT